MNYVFFSSKFKPVNAMWSDVKNLPNVCFYDYPFIIGKISMLYTKYKLFPPMYKYFLKKIPFNMNEKITFIYMNPWPTFMIETGILDWIKKKFRNSFHVVRLADIHTARKIDLELLKKHYDLISIYDESEAFKLGITYYPAVYSKNFKSDFDVEETYDLSFVGQAKNRYKELISIYEKAISLGLKCKFLIVGVNKKDRLYTGKIIYSNKFIDEKKYFEEFIKPSKCLLELVLEQTFALTARVREAIMYDKKILSNNKSLANHLYYNQTMMKVYNTIDDIDETFFRVPKKAYNYQNDFSPLHFLNYLEKYFDR